MSQNIRKLGISQGVALNKQGETSSTQCTTTRRIPEQLAHMLKYFQPSTASGKEICGTADMETTREVVSGKCNVVPEISEGTGKIQNATFQDSGSKNILEKGSTKVSMVSSSMKMSEPYSEYGNKKPVVTGGKSTSEEPYYAKRTSLGWLRGDINETDFHSGKFFVKKQKVTFEGINDENPKCEPKQSDPTKSSLKFKIDGMVSGEEVESPVEGSINNVYVDTKSQTLKGTCTVQEPGSNVKKSVPYQQGGKFHLPIIFGGEEVIAQWDSGADCTLVSPEFYMSMKNKPKLDFDIMLKGYNQGSQRGKFCEDVEFQIGNYSFNFPPAIGPSTVPLLIGVDFLRTFNIDMSVTKSHIILGEDVIPLEYTGADTSKCEYSICNVRLDCNITIPPHQGRTFVVNSKTKSKELRYFEPHPFEEVQMSDSVVRQDGKVPISMMNFTDQKQRMYKGMTIGFMTECNEITIENLTSEELDEKSEETGKVEVEMKKVSSEIPSPKGDGEAIKMARGEDISDGPNIPEPATQKKPKITLKNGKSVKMPTTYNDIPNKFKIPQTVTNKYKEWEDFFPAMNSEHFENLTLEVPEHTRDMFKNLATTFLYIRQQGLQIL